MWFRLRKTARRGRSAVPRTFFRMRLCTPRLMSAFVVCAIIQWIVDNGEWTIFHCPFSIFHFIFRSCPVLTYKTYPRNARPFLCMRPVFEGGSIPPPPDQVSAY